VDPSPIRPSLRYRVEHRPTDRAGCVLAAEVGLRAAAGVFEDEFRRLAHAGKWGTLALVCELPGLELQVATRRVVPGGAN
jgi:hypothetical protein